VERVIMTKAEERLAEKKLLLAIYIEEIFEGKLFRQERPFCCGLEIDLLAAKLTFQEVKIQNHVFTLLEPFCPICGQVVKVIYHINC